MTAKRRTDDLEFPWEEAEKSYQWARRVFELYGAGDKIAHIESTTRHGYQEDKRAHLYEWIERELLRAPSGVQGEIPVALEPLETLRVGLPDGNKTFYDIYREWLDEVPPPRPPTSPEEFAVRVSAARPALAKVLGLPTGLKPAVVREIRTAENEGVHARFFAVETEPGVTIPAAEFRAGGDGPKPFVFLVGDRARRRGVVEEVLAAGDVAVVVEPRGAGEVDWGGRRTDNASWFFGRPRPGQEAFDVLRTAEAWRARPDVSSISLISDGRWGKAALFAAALDAKISALDVALPATDRAQFESGGRAALADVPGLIRVGDLPQVAALVAPRPCVLRVPDAGPYEWTRTVFRGMNSDGLDVIPAPAP